MARKTGRWEKAQRKIVLLLALVFAVALIAAAMLAFPQFSLWLQRALGILQGQGPTGPWQQQPVAVHIIDVGQGDAALLCADGEYALIDAGTPESADVLVEYLRRAGVNRLKYLFLTHPHADHMGGMVAVLSTLAVENMVLPDLSLAPLPASRGFEELLATLQAKEVATQQAVLGASYPLGNGHVTVVHAGLPTENNYNLLSLGLLFEAGKLRVLNTGDGEKPNERAMLESGLSLEAGAFLAAHHGSSTSNLPEFLQAVRPGVVAVSCGAGNSYGHPHHSPMQDFQKLRATVLQTDEAGHILLWADETGRVCWATGAQQPTA